MVEEFKNWLSEQTYYLYLGNTLTNESVVDVILYTETPGGTSKGFSFKEFMEIRHSESVLNDEYEIYSYT